MAALSVSHVCFQPRYPRRVEFDEAVPFSVTLTVWNLNGSSELTQFDMITSGGYAPYYKETFEDESFRAEEWEIWNPDDKITWDFFETGGTVPGKTSAGIDFFHYYSIGKRDRLITPQLNLENMTSAALEFQYAYAKRIPQLTDSLIIYISSNCGESWTRVFADGDDGSGNFATHEQTEYFWPQEREDWCMSGYGATCISIDLSPWAGLPNIKIAFESWSGYGNPMFIDNVEISQFVGENKKTPGSTDLLVFPNPTNDFIHLVLPDNSKFYEVRLINQFGQILNKTKILNGIKKYKIQVKPNWPKGVYFLQFIDNDSVIIKQIIIN